MHNWHKQVRDTHLVWHTGLRVGLCAPGAPCTKGSFSKLDSGSVLRSVQPSGGNVCVSVTLTQF